MPLFLKFFFRHAWLMFVAMTCINVLYLKTHSREQIRQRPELAAGYRKLIRGYLFWGNCPGLSWASDWSLAGCPAFSRIFAHARNPFVLAFFCVVIAEWILSLWWLFFARGAEFLVEHPGVLRGFPRSPTLIRLYYCLCVAGGAAGVLFMWFSDIPEFTQ
jgi:hypothetical protein